MPKHNQIQYMLDMLLPNIWQKQTCLPNYIYMPDKPNIWWAYCGMYTFVYALYEVSGTNHMTRSTVHTHSDNNATAKNTPWLQRLHWPYGQISQKADVSTKLICPPQCHYTMLCIFFFFGIMVGLCANRVLCICSIMSLHPKCMGQTSECRK